MKHSTQHVTREGHGTALASPSRRGVAAARYMGRRTSGGLSASKRELLDKSLPLYRLPERKFASREDLCSVFSGIAAPQRLVLEIGFGNGEQLISSSRRGSAHHDEGKTLWIGCEVFLNGIASTVRALQQEAITCVRIADRDADTLLEQLPEGAIDQIIALFPDPWTKARHKKRRLYASGRLPRLHRLLRAGGLLRVASDNAEYIADLLDTASEARWQLDLHDRGPRPAGLPITRYYKKAIAACRDVQLVQLRALP